MANVGSSSAAKTTGGRASTADSGSTTPAMASAGSAAGGMSVKGISSQRLSDNSSHSAAKGKTQDPSSTKSVGTASKHIKSNKSLRGPRGGSTHTTSSVASGSQHSKLGKSSHTVKSRDSAGRTSTHSNDGSSSSSRNARPPTDRGVPRKKTGPLPTTASSDVEVERSKVARHNTGPSLSRPPPHPSSKDIEVEPRKNPGPPLSRSSGHIQMSSRIIKPPSSRNGMRAPSTHSRGPPVATSSTHSTNSAVVKSNAMVAKGYDYGTSDVTDEEQAEKSEISSQGSFAGDDDDDASVDSVFWEERERDIKNPLLKCVVGCLVVFKFIPKDPLDCTPVKNGLRAMQWAALILDLASAVVAITTFSGNTYCCEEPVLNMLGTAPWDKIVPIATYVYAALIVAEIYPVVSKGFPFNIVNPIFGSALTIAMFFDDSMFMAVSMWSLEALAVLCECTIYILKSAQKRAREKEIPRLGRQTKRDRKPGESQQEYEDNLTKIKMKYFEIQEIHKNEHKMLWYLALANIINLALLAGVLILIIFTYKAGGLCIDFGTVPNPFASDQLGLCAGVTCTDAGCEYCQGDRKMCYYDYY